MEWKEDPSLLITFTCFSIAHADKLFYNTLIYLMTFLMVRLAIKEYFRQCVMFTALESWFTEMPLQTLWVNRNQHFIMDIENNLPAYSVVLRFMDVPDELNLALQINSSPPMEEFSGM